MPSHKPVKTYQKKTRLQLDSSSKSVDAINALFAQNLTKRLKSRRKAKLKLKELPARTAAYLTDDSLKVEPNNTFDKLLKGKVYNEVKVGNFVKIRSESESSKSQVSFHSPIMTRRRKKTSLIINEVSQTSKEITERTPITSSLSIEKEKKASFHVSSLSYIKLPKITENEISLEKSYKPIFSDTFRERQAIHSSTPCLAAPSKKLITDAISPITNDSSSSSKLIERSYDQIRQWDEIFPNLGDSTPKRKSLRISGGRRRKLSTVPPDDDWKLKCQPKVYLKSSDRIQILDFRGFSQEEQSSSSKESSRILEWLSSMSEETRSYEKKRKRRNNGVRENGKKVSIKINKKKKLSKGSSRISLSKRVSNRKTRNSSEAVESLPLSKRVSKKKSSDDRARSSAQSLKLSERVSKRRSSNHRARSSPQSSKLSKRVGKRKSSAQSLKLSERVGTRKSSDDKTRSSAQSSKLAETVSKRRSSRSSAQSLKVSERVSKRESSDDRARSSANSERVSKRRSSDGGARSSAQSLKLSERVSKRGSSDDKARSSANSERVSKRRSSDDRARSVKVSERVSKRKSSAQSLGVSDELAKPQRKSARNKDKQSLDLQKSEEISHESLTLPKSLQNSSPRVRSSRLRKPSEEKKIFVTLRRRGSPVRNTKKIDVASSSRKSKIKPLCVNVTADILSEKEVSYSSNSTSFDFTSESSRSNISYRTEELKEKEISLPKMSRKEDVITVDLKDFDNFMQSYYETETKKERKLSVITLSDDSILRETLLSAKKPKPTSTMKVEVVATPEQDKTQNSSVNRSLDFLISPKAVSKRNSESSKIIILSNITLGVNNKPITKTDHLKNVNHDHSYSNSPNNTQNVGLSDIIESSLMDNSHSEKNRKVRPKSIKLKPGKSYRRSLSLLKRSSVLVDALNSGLCHDDCVCLKCLFRSKLNHEKSRSSQIVPVSRKSLSNSVLENYARRSACYVPEEDYIDNLDESVRGLSLNARNSIVQNLPVTAKDVVLRRCGQTEVLPFEECYPRSSLQHCHKIGEGVYGEVFLCRNQNGGTSVMKVIPIEGDLIVNGERQKKFDEILSEIVIAMELSNLRNNKKNTTTGFTEVQKVRCTQGNYPDRLLDLWELYDETKGSENDSPQMFPSNQVYIVLELANGGQDLESYPFTNASQAFAMFKQTACALAVAEDQLKFEHRDLHWGNILISTVDKAKTLRFRLNGQEIEVETQGVESAIIDFTLSRIEFEGVVIFNDLSLDDELFVAKGDYQFDIYRLMQESNENEWQHFEPYTNVLWLHYLLDKVAALRYKNPRTKIHKEYLGQLNKMKDEILSYNSVTEFVTDKFV